MAFRVHVKMNNLAPMKNYPGVQGRSKVTMHNLLVLANFIQFSTPKNIHFPFKIFVDLFL